MPRSWIKLILPVLSEVVGLSFGFSFTVGAKPLCTNKPGVQLRRAPSSKSKLSWKVPKLMPLMSTGKRQNGDWLEVKDMDGQTHWVSSKEVTDSLTCVVVRTRSTRLRQGPGKQFQASPLGIADRYSTFLDLGGEDGWIQVESESGEKGWLNMDHIWHPTLKARLVFDQ